MPKPKKGQQGWQRRPEDTNQYPHLRLTTTKIDEFLKSANVMRLASKSREHYEVVMVHIFLRALKDIQISDTDLSVRRQWVMDQFTQHCIDVREISGTSIKIYLGTIKVWFRWMGTPLNYTYRVDKKELRDSALKRMDRWFTEDEVLKILNHPMRLRTALMLRLLVETGIRVQELSNIVGNDIDIQERTLRVKVSKTKPRVVFFSPKTVDLLIEHDETVKFIKIFPKKRLFPGIPQIQLAVNTTLVELGLKEKQDGRGPHTFRHYFATFLFYVGDMWIGDIARLMGDTPDVVEKTYLHPTSTMLRKRVDKAMDW